jgi:fructose-1,6-bisphosphatase/inositol monophosphatase family enzyme
MVNTELVDAGLVGTVAEIVREVAGTEVTPRWRRLEPSEIDHKSGTGDPLVTVADRASERALTARLTALLPGSTAVAEEAVSADRSLLDRLRGDAPVWVVDPVDGTANFAAGKPDFAVLVALVRHGETLASWTDAPARGLFATARRGAGARLTRYVPETGAVAEPGDTDEADGAAGETAARDTAGTGPADRDARPDSGTPLATGSPAPGAELRVAASNPAYLSEARRRPLDGLTSDPAVRSHPCTCAGLAYLDLARGRLDALAFAWESPWDHAAGLLLVAEAGGASGTVAGQPFRLAGGNTLPFAAARDTATRDRVLGMIGGGAR